MIEQVSDGATTRQTTIAALVQASLKKASVLSNVFYDVSQYAEQGTGTIAFPRKSNEFTVQKLSGSQKGDDQELVFALDSLVLSEEAHIQWVIKKFDEYRAKAPILASAIEEATLTHASQLDDDMIDALLANISISNITGGIDQEAIVDAIVALNTARVPRTNRAFVFGNSGYGTLIKIAGFVDASKSNLDIVKTGQIGTLYGYPVFESDSMPTAEGLLTHRDALAFGFGSMPEVEDQAAIEYGTGSRRWVMDALYGVKTLNAGKMAVRIV